MPGLDADELFHLGLHALRNDNPEDAIKRLKECLDLNPADARATYLLGATYAQVGMYDRARELLQQSILLNPQEYTAVFQLGLLYLTSGDVARGRETWEQLDTLGSEHFLHLFKSAMLALAEDDFERCVALIDRGMASNTANEALNRDMQQVRTAAVAALGENGGAEAVGSTADNAASHFALSGYQQMSEKK